MIDPGRFSFVALITVLGLALSVGCGGGGVARGHVTGILTDGFGAVINHPSAVITLEGTGVTGHPGSGGSFTLTAAPGSYLLRGSLVDSTEGLLLQGSQNVVLIDGETLDVGLFQISNSTLETGWSQYRQEQYPLAQNTFNSYLNEARTGQAHLGASSALNGLGWTRGRGLNRPEDAAKNFQEAIDGWNGNVDAWVGLAASELSRMRSDGGFHFNQSVDAITTAIDASGEYTSTPAHDQISEIDLHAFRVLVNYLNGNTVNARNEAINIQDQVTSEGNNAGAEAIAVVLAFTQ